MAPYRTQSEDTTRAAEERILDHLRRLTPAERATEVTELCRTMHAVVQTGIRLRHPDADERELFHRTAAHWLGAELVKRVYGWDVEVQGW